jgi:probable HAF family extracellular repeat protein
LNCCARASTLDDPLAIGGGTNAHGINNAGQIVGSYTDGSGTHGFLRSSGGSYTTLDDPLATNGTFANGINDLGQIVGTYNTLSGTHSFLYNGGIFTTIDDPVVNSTGHQQQ